MIRSTDLYFKRIRDIKEEMYPFFQSIYSVSFPLHEQRSEEQQLMAFKDSRYFLCGVSEDEKLIAFIAYWEFEDYIYIEHFAVHPERRGKNIGSKVLQVFAEKVKKTILLEIDPPVDSVSNKRLEFYRRLGYKANPYSHFHPPYIRGHKPHELMMLSLNREIDQAFYNRFYDDLVRVVMKPE